jgi:hypothetical protein
VCISIPDVLLRLESFRDEAAARHFAEALSSAIGAAAHLGETRDEAAYPRWRTVIALLAYCLVITLSMLGAIVVMVESHNLRRDWPLLMGAITLADGLFARFVLGRTLRRDAEERGESLRA